MSTSVLTWRPGPRTTPSRAGVRQAEQYYLARVRPENVRPQSAASPDNIQVWRWWSLAELTSTSQTVYPAELTGLLRHILASGPPPAPLTLKWPASTTW